MIRQIRLTLLFCQFEIYLCAIDVQFLACTIQTGQLDVSCADRQHFRFEEFNIAIRIAWNDAIFGNRRLVWLRLPKSKYLQGFRFLHFIQSAIPSRTSLYNLIRCFPHLDCARLFNPNLAWVQRMHTIACVHRLVADVAQCHRIGRVNGLEFQ